MSHFNFEAGASRMVNSQTGAWELETIRLRQDQPTASAVPRACRRVLLPCFIKEIHKFFRTADFQAK